MQILENLREMQINTGSILSELKDNVLSIETCCYKQFASKIRIQTLFEARQQFEISDTKRIPSS